MFLSVNTYAQRCATVEYQLMMQDRLPQLEEKAGFEDWLRQKKEKRYQGLNTREEAIVYTIPVVVHIIHNGEALGVGRNIPDQQILSQIEALTEDFRRQNADASKTPEMFLPVAADVELEFVLAKQDPEGLPTSGIVRVDGGQPDWDLEENYELKSLSYWPAEDYLNIWVTDLSGVYLGFAQFPTSDQLSGLEDSSGSRSTDGVVIDYRAFGSKEKYPPANLVPDYDLGRTTTHEIGHFFGLRHIWGDDSGGCTESDYVDDTPNQGGSTNNCPTTSTTSCSSTDMIQNYMDYTHDACMNIFTIGQKERMRIVVDNSPRRASLRTSKGAVAPVIVSNDLGIRSIINPNKFACSGTTAPRLEIRNYGDNSITSAEITVVLDGVMQESASFPLNLNPLEINVVTFSPVNITTTGEHTVEFEIVGVNQTTDGKADNNFGSETVVVPGSVAIPMRENFNNPLWPIPDNWTVLNPDKRQTWSAISADNGELNNTSLYMNFYNYEIEGEYDTLLTPVFDLTDVPFAIVSFARAYAKYPGFPNDGLIVKLSTDCGKTFEHTLYEAYGDKLATAPEMPAEFIPSGSQDWKRECLILESFLGLPNIRLAFIAKNGNGNNLYLDDVFIDTSDDASNFKDFGILSLSQPSLVSCQEEVSPMVIVKNQGCTIENQFTLTYQFDDGPQVTATYNPGNINPGQTVEVALEDGIFEAGEHTYVVTLTDANDQDTLNDQISGVFYINNERDEIPVKEDFENFATSDWLVPRMDESNSWQTIPTNFGTSVFLDAASGLNQDQWLVSPVLDFSTASEATLSFDLAYSFAEVAKDGLRILVSTDCGITYEDVIFNRFSEDLNTGEFTDIPSSDEDWSTITLNMNQYLGRANVRIAFVGTSVGNDIFLDNIQIFVTQHAVSGINQIYPNPSEDGLINITFDLPEKETVQVLMYNIKGQLRSEFTFTNTLNQTYTFDYRNEPQGLYLMKVVGESFSYVKRIVLRP